MGACVRKPQKFTGQGIIHTVTASFDELDFEYATSVAEKAIRSMAEQRVPPTPNNFHVWFKYVLGTPPVLKRAIDILIGNKRKFDAATNREIYANYVGSKAAERGRRLRRLAATAFGDGVRQAVPDHGDCRQPHANGRRSATSPSAAKPASIRKC